MSRMTIQPCLRLTHEVGTDLQSLISPHNDPDLSILPVLQQLDVPGTSLFPLYRRLFESEQLCSHLEEHIFVLFVGLDLYLLGKLDDGFVVGVVLLNLEIQM
jgi:hypothetical protein